MRRSPGSKKAYGQGADGFVAKLDPARKQSVQALRKLIRKAGPSLEETVKWGMPCYTGKENVCCIMVFRDHVNLGFFKGTSLGDPAGILEGTGKGLRHVKVYKASDIKERPVTALIRQAAAIDGKSVDAQVARS